jgi:acyl dehydratase
MAKEVCAKRVPAAASAWETKQMGVSFEDLVVGSRQEIGMHTFTAGEIVEFAERFDPQPFHIDEAAASASPFGGLIASGWHTCSVLMGISVRNLLEGSTSMGSPGIDEIRWIKPVRPGDTIRLFTSILDKRVSTTRPDRGVVTLLWEGVNQAGETAVTVRSKVLFGLRGSAEGPQAMRAGKPGRAA